VTLDASRAPVSLKANCAEATYRGGWEWVPAQREREREREREMNGENVKHLPLPDIYLSLKTTTADINPSSQLWLRAIGLVFGVRIRIIKDRVSVCVRVVVMVTIWGMGGRFLRW